MAEVLGVIAGFITLLVLWKPLIGDWQQFQKGVKTYLTPSSVSVATGQWREGFLPGLKLLSWIICGVIIGFAVRGGTYYLLK